MADYDVCIVGAGVLGAAVARELSRYELRILWLEKAQDVGTGITRGNTSIVHGGFDDAQDSVKGRYSPHGVALIEALDQQLHFGFRKCGSLIVALSPEGRPQLKQLLANGRTNGVRGLELWEQGQLREREPNLNPEAECALFAKESGVLIGPEYCIALAENALANGVELRFGEELLELEKEADGYRLTSSKGSYSCRYLVNAAGWGAPKIAQMLGSLNCELQAVKGQYLVFDRSCGQLVQHVLFPLPDKVKGKGVTVCPTYHGNLLLGPDAEFVSDSTDLSTQLSRLQDIYRQGQNLVPGIPRSKVIRSYAGMRPRFKGLLDKDKSFVGQTAPRFGDFLIRYFPDRCELLGIASPGITSALPIAAELAEKLAQYWAAQNWDWREKSNFRSERQAYMPSQRDKEFVPGRELKNYTDLPLDNPDCLVCRCEQVSSRTIQEAVRRSGQDFATVSQNLDFLKWRSRVTMGFCQGQFCKPRLKELLAKLSNAAPEQIAESLGRNWERVPLDILRSSL